MKIKRRTVKEIIKLLEQASKGGGAGAALFEEEKSDIIKMLKRML